MDHNRPRVRWREIIAVGLIVALCDVTIYRGAGFAGCAAMLVLAPLLLLAGAPALRLHSGVALIGGMLALLAMRLVWCGSAWQAAIGFALLIAFAMTLTGMKPHVLESVFFGAQLLIAGFEGVQGYGRFLTQRSPAVGPVRWLTLVRWLSFLLPLMAFLAFGMIFVLANPDLMTLFGQEFQRLFRSLHDALMRFAPTPTEMLFWAAVAWVSVGLLRPVIEGTHGADDG